MRYVLASGSPRRREILARIVGEFELLPTGADESFDRDLPPQAVCTELAERKCRSAMRTLSCDTDAVIIAADTMVFKDGVYYGKPGSVGQACAILRALSGGVHEVYTGVAVTCGACVVIGYEVSRVYFSDFSEAGIAEYVALCKPFDKAGAYGIQEIAPYCGVRFDGAYDNIVGLPVELTKRLINEVQK